MKIKNERGKIIIYPTKTVITNYTERIPQIEGSLSVYDKVKHCYSFQAFIKDEINNMITIPNCFTNNYLKSLLPNHIIDDSRENFDELLKLNHNFIPITMKYDFKNELQEKTVKFLKRKRKYSPMQSFICLKTGKGKTYCTVRYIVESESRAIIFVDQEALAEQWKERILEYTDVNENEIYYISGNPSVKRLMKYTDSQINSIKFFICCYRTLTSKIINTENPDYDYITDLIYHININLKVFDEAHIEYKSIFRLDMLLNSRSIYLTATPKRSDPAEDKVYQNIFSLVDKFSEDTSNTEKEENYHNIVIYNWNSNPTTKNNCDCQTNYGFSTVKYCNYIEENKFDEFKELLMDLIFNQIYKNRRKKKIAILFGKNSLIEKFNECLINYINENKYKINVGIFNSTIKKDERYKVLENNDIILTTDKSFDKAMDVNDLRVLINTVPFSSDTKLTQVIGRLRKIPDREVFFFDVNDIGFDGIKGQLNLKKEKVYKIIGKNVYLKTYKK